MCVVGGIMGNVGRSLGGVRGSLEFFIIGFFLGLSRVVRVFWEELFF